MRPVQARYDLDFEWVGFELHPDIPVGGIDLAEYFPGGKIEAMRGRLQDMAEALGVPIGEPARAPSTKPALVVSERARERGVLDAFRTLTMDAYWRDNRDIEDRAVLLELAAQAGLAVDDAAAALDDPQAPQILLRQRREAMMWGVTGIPTWFMLPDGWTPDAPPPEKGAPQPVQVVGCQPLEVVEHAAKLAGARELPPGPTDAEQ